MIPRNPIKSQLPVDIRNVIVLSLVVVIESIQLMLLAAWIVGFFPWANPLADVVFKEWLPFVSPQRQMWFFWFFVGTAIGFQMLGLKIFRRKLSDPDFEKELTYFCWAEGILLFFILSALFKMVVYEDHKTLAQYAYTTLLILAVLHKIFWRRVKIFFQTIYAFLTANDNTVFLRKLAGFSFVLLIVAVIYVPNTKATIGGRLLIGDQFTHFNSFVFAPAWAYTSGNILYVDQISQYGLGMPIFLSHLAKLLGGFNEPNVFLAIMWGCIFYYLLLYGLLQLWYRSLPLTILGILLGIRIQMFHTGVFPFVLALPSATVIRYWFDVLFFILILCHLKKPQSIFLWLAGLGCGVAVFCMISTGMYLLGCFYLYLVLNFFRPDFKVKPSHVIGYVLIAPLTAAGLMWITVREHLWTQKFWQNMFGFINYLVSGAGTLPIFASFKTHDFLASLMGFVIPVFYVFTILMVGSLWWRKKLAFEHLFVVLLCIYGLGLNQYYILFSAMTSYYTGGLPFILVAGYWIRVGLNGLSPGRYKKILMMLIGVAAYALVTNHNFLSYPSLLNLSRNPLTDPLVSQALPPIYTQWTFSWDDQLKEFYEKTLDFTKDAQLIQSLTDAHIKVPVISSFEIKILMQANRRPFFYHFPLLVPQVLSLNAWAVSGLYTTEYLKETIAQLEDEKPQWIFLQRIYLNLENIPKHFEYYFPSLLSLLRYVHANYSPATEGEYLVAMKRKDTSL